MSPSDAGKSLVRALVDRSAPVFDNWSESTASVWLRAGFSCEYCDRYLLESYDSYRLADVEHILPKEVYGECRENGLALACRVCNLLKLRIDIGNADLWERLDNGCANTRQVLVRDYRDRIAQMREEKELALKELRAYVEQSGCLAHPLSPS